MLVNKLNLSYQGAFASNLITIQAIRQSPTSPNYFFISDDTSVYDSTGISRYRAPLDGSGVTHTGYKTTAELVSKMVKSEVYSIIYAGQITSNDFYLIDMHSLDEVVKLQLPGRPLSFTPVIGFVGKLTEDIGFVNAVSKGFEVWKLIGDFCLITGQNPCQ